MDLVVLSKSFQSGGPRQIGQSQNQLRGLTQHIEKLGIAQPHTATFIGRSKVPIIKFTDRRTGIKVDISFENDSGFPALKTFQTWKREYPAMPVIVALVKQLLVMRGINEVYCGGIGGFTTICLVTHILQTMPEVQAGASDPQQHYGEIFMKFLDFYGNKIDIRAAGIIMQAPYLYDKDKYPKAVQNKDRLTIIDPNNENNDIAGGSHKIDTVFGRFRSAFTDLRLYMDQLHKGKVSTNSILECILGGNYQPVETQRNRLRQLYGTMTPSAAPALPPAPYIPPGVKDTPAPRAKKPNKKAKLREQKAAEAQGQYTPPAQKAAPPASSAPKYVAPMAGSPLRSNNDGRNGIVPIIAPPFHYSQYPSFPPYIPPYSHTVPQHFCYSPTAGFPPGHGIPPPPLAIPPPPPPPEPRETKAPSSPASSVSMEMSD
jgi:DNA polymerase sigma